MVTRGLIIDEPWISKILNGEKAWEMRSTRTNIRGVFGLIRKGSGQVVGLATLTDVSGPYNNNELNNKFSLHRISHYVFKSPDYKWRYAWELKDVVKLRNPVPYVHKSGAVIWVELDNEAINSIAQQLEPKNGVTIDIEESVESEMAKLFGGDATGGRAIDKRGDSSQGTCSIVEKYDKPDTKIESPGGENCVRGIRIKLTQGNINNAHFYIPRSTTLFPESVWGGKNKLEAGQSIEIIFTGIDESTHTDIDGSKRIFRSRAVVRQFFRLHGLRAGDELEISRVSDGLYKIEVV